MQSVVTNAKYINIVFSWEVKNNDAFVKNEVRRRSAICVKGYWQGFIDLENFGLLSIEDLNYPLGSRIKVFNSGMYIFLGGNSTSKFTYHEETSNLILNSHVGDNVIYIGIGKDGVIVDYVSNSGDYILFKPETSLEYQNFKRLYESVISLDEVINVVKDANLIGKAVQIMLECWQDDRDDSGELCLLNVLRKALKCETPMQIQSMLLRDVLQNSYITCQELLDQGFSYEAI